MNPTGCDHPTPPEHEPTGPTRWADLRAVTLHRDDYTCQLCGDPATDADHKWPKSKGGADKLSNLQALCGPCNREKADKLFLRHITTDRLTDAAGHELQAAAEAVRRAARWLRLAALLDEAGESLTIDEMGELDDRAKHGENYGRAIDMLRELVTGGTDPAVTMTLAHIGEHGDLPPYWDEMLDLPVALGDSRVQLRSLLPEDLHRLVVVLPRDGKFAAARGAKALVEMMKEESVLRAGDLRAVGFVDGVAS